MKFFILFIVIFCLSGFAFAKFDRSECNEYQAILLLEGVDRILVRDIIEKRNPCEFLSDSSDPYEILKSCKPSGDNCLYYRCLDRNEHFKKCKENNYAWKYGLYYCYTFNCETAKKISERAQEWVAEVNHCIQAHIKEWSLKNPYGECEGVSNAGYDAHVPCYNNSDFCDLKVMDQFHIGTTPTFADFIRPIALKQAYGIGLYCSEFYLNKVIDYSKEVEVGETLAKWKSKFNEMMK